MTRSSPTRMTIGLSADLDSGEGDITGKNLDKLEQLHENPLLAMDVIGDWIADLRWHYLKASFAFAGEMWRVGIEAGHKKAPTIEDLKGIYDDFAVAYNEVVLAGDFAWWVGTDIDDEWEEWLRTATQNDEKVVQLRPRLVPPFPPDKHPAA